MSLFCFRVSRMTHRPVATTAKTGRISHLEARRLAHAVRVGKESGKYSKQLPWSARKTGATTTALERFLGHFGTATPKRSTARRAARRAGTKKGHRRSG